MSWQRRERRRPRRRGDIYLNSLTGAERQAYDLVRLCIAAMGERMAKLHNEATPTNNRELHRFVSIFGEKIGADPTLYRVEGGRCWAVDVYYETRSGEEDRFFLIYPLLVYWNFPEQIDDHSEVEKVRAAAVEVCRAWLPKWEWKP